MSWPVWLKLQLLPERHHAWDLLVRSAQLASISSPQLSQINHFVNSETPTEEKQGGAPLEQMGHILLAGTLLTPPASRSLLQNTGRSSRRSAAWTDPKERTARRSRLRPYLWHQNWRVRGETLDAEIGGITVKSSLGYVSVKYLPIRLCLSTYSKPSLTLSYKPCEGNMVLFTFC